MKRITIIAFAIMILMGLIGVSQADGRWEDEEITISPRVLVLDYSGTRITIHTKIQASEVVGSSVYIEVNSAGRVDPCSVFADDCGNLVAKFEVEQVRVFVQPPSAEIILHGDLVSGGKYSATGSIEVK
jgi:hypothetical protein